MKRCYYEILDVDKKATPTQIKQSYRKMAIKYHPDKNPSQDAKHKFIQITEAYNVLSDPNERTWYDTNREKVLFNKEDMSKEDLEQYSFGFNIWLYFTTSCFNGFENGPEGFYGVYREVFEKIKIEEKKAFNSRQDLEEQFRKLEGFGDSNTTEDKMLRFYQDWDNFTTYKSFVWSQEWDTRQANNRWMRREMEKENKKQRQGQKKTYIKTIKDLVAYVKKRDPRFRQYQIKVKEEEEKKAQEKIEKEKKKKQEKEQMKVVKQQLEEERFREVEEYFKRQNEGPGPKVEYEHEEEQREDQFYCELCQKGFKSENAKRNHEKSKQHKQNVKLVQKQVMSKEERFQPVIEEQKKQAEIVEEKVDEAPKKKNRKKKKKGKVEQDIESEEEQKKAPKVQEVKVQQKPVEVEKQDSQSDDDDAFMNSLLNNRKKAQGKQISKEQSKPEPKKAENKKKQVIQQQQSESDDSEPEQKLNKAKIKKQKKAQQQKAGKANALKCNVCNESFPSKTKLFDHIKKTGHASAK